MESKRELLLTVCEHPSMAFDPISASSSAARWVEELTTEGWITTTGSLGDRGIELHATDKALDKFPKFEGDIAEPEPPHVADSPPTVSAVDSERVVRFVANLLDELPMGRVCACAVAPHRHEEDLVVKIAREIVQDIFRVTDEQLDLEQNDSRPERWMVVRLDSKIPGGLRVVQADLSETLARRIAAERGLEAMATSMLYELRMEAMGNA